MLRTLRFVVIALATGALSSISVPSASAQEATAADSALQVRKHLSFGQRYLKNRQYEDAEGQFFKAWEFSGEKEGRAAYYLGRTLNESERYEEAIEWFEKAEPLVSKNSKTYQNIFYYLGGIHVLLENKEEAIAAYQSALETPGLSAERKIQYLHHLVSLSAETEAFEQALDYARQWGEVAPDDPEVLDMIAKLAMHTGSEDEALAEKEKILEMNPNDWETLEWLGTQYKQRGDLDRALDAFNRLTEHSPTNFLYLDNLLDISINLNRSRSSQIDLLQRMQKIQPQNLRVLELLADKTGSLNWINRGLKVDPGSGKLNYLKGEHYFRQWKGEGGKQDSVRALTWYGKAKSDPQWTDNAQRMIWEINPPLSDEEKKRREFFNKTKKQEEVEIKGKK